MTTPDEDTVTIDGWTAASGDAAYLAHLAAQGVLRQADELFDRIEAGEDLGPLMTVDEVIDRCEAIIESRRREAL